MSFYSVDYMWTPRNWVFIVWNGWTQWTQKQCWQRSFIKFYGSLCAKKLTFVMNLKLREVWPYQCWAALLCCAVFCFCLFLNILRNEIYNFSASIELISTSKHWNKRQQCSLAWGENLYSFLKFLTTSGHYKDHLQKYSFIPLNDGGSFYKHIKRSAIGQL